MAKLPFFWLALLSFFCLVSNRARSEERVSFPLHWTAESPREEIRPDFAFDPHGGPQKKGAFVISHDHREGLDGWMQRSFDVRGGEFVRFQTLRKLTGVQLPRRSALVRVLWKAEDGRMVSADVPEEQIRSLGHVPTAEPEHPVDGPTNAEGWTLVSGIYRVPTKASNCDGAAKRTSWPRALRLAAVAGGKRPASSRLGPFNEAKFGRLMACCGVRPQLRTP